MSDWLLTYLNTPLPLTILIVVLGLWIARI